MNKKIHIFIGVIFLILIPLWICVIAPQLTKLPNNFSYKANIVSIDNLYDETLQKFSGEKRSVTLFSYEAVAQKKGVLEIKNTFDVRKVNGEKIFVVERLYGVNSKTSEHIAGFGDHDRSGYLFAPKNLQKGQPFTYWHVNYDGPAHMTFVREENLLGLSVYRYETDYKGVTIDQTKNLNYLPNVGITRGVKLEPHLELWVEPITGRLIQYKDDTFAYYYDLKTGERLSPWNHFTNSYANESVLEQVKITKQQKLYLNLIQCGIPILLALLFIIFLLFYFRKNKVIKFLLVSFLILFVLVGIGKSAFLKYKRPSEKITIGSYAGELASLLYIADEKGYFKDEDIDLEIKPYQAGILAIPDLVAGKIDFSLGNEFAPVIKSFNNPDIKILAAINKTNSYEFIARRDHGISMPVDLKGKRIGITKNTQSEYFLGTFLIVNSLTLSDVEIVDIKPLDIPSAMVSGTIDAALTWTPHSYNIKKELGTNATIWPGQSGQYTYLVLIGTDTLVKTRPQTVERVLRALVKAEKFVKQNQIEAQNIVMNTIKTDHLYMKSVWPLNTFEVSLNQSLLRIMEDEARFVIGNKLTDKTLAPNYIDFIYTDALRKVKLDAVTLY